MTHADFLRAIATHPADMGPRLTFADWLEERDDEDRARAEFIRCGMELAGATGCGNCVDPSEGYYCFKCEMIRSRLAALLTPDRRRAWVMAGLPDGWGYDLLSRSIVPQNYDWNNPHIDADFNAGAIEHVTCRWEEWRTHHAAICAAHPVRIVRITNPVVLDTTIRDGVLFYSLQGTNNYRSESILRLTGMDNIYTQCLTAEIPGADPQHPIHYELAATLAREPARG